MQVRTPPATRPVAVNPEHVVAPSIRAMISSDSMRDGRALQRNGSLAQQQPPSPRAPIARSVTSPDLRRIESTRSQVVTSSPPPTTVEFGPMVLSEAPSRAPSIRYASTRVVSPTDPTNIRDRFKRLAQAAVVQARQQRQQVASSTAPPLPVIDRPVAPPPIHRPATYQNGGDSQAANDRITTAGFPRYVYQPCPFLPSDEQVEALYEIGSVNYAVYEGFKQRRPDLARQFDRAVQEAMLRILASAGVSIDPRNLWTQVRPGLLGAAVLQYDTNELKPCLADADWPLRIRVVVRCAPQDTMIIVSALERIGFGNVLIPEPFDIFHSVQSAVLGPCTLQLIDHTAPESGVDGMRQASSPVRALGHVPEGGSGANYSQRQISTTQQGFGVPPVYDYLHASPSPARLYSQAAPSPSRDYHNYSHTPRALQYAHDTPTGLPYTSYGREASAESIASAENSGYRFIRTR